MSIFKDTLYHRKKKTSTPVKNTSKMSSGAHQINTRNSFKNYHINFANINCNNSHY